jgi:hypothetical protein
MAKGPRRGQRPADVIGAAMKIAVGEEPKELTDDGKDKAAVSLGRRGGKARADKLSKKRRQQIAQTAALARWRKG